MLRFSHRFLVAGVLLALSAGAGAQSTDVDFWFEKMLEKKNEGYDGIDDMTRKTDSMGMSTMEYYEKTSAIELDNGQTVYIMRQVPPSEIQERQSGGSLSPGELEAGAQAVETAGLQMEQAMMTEMNETGLPGGMAPLLMNPPPDEPWLSPNPRDMTSMYATMLRAGARAQVEMAEEKANTGSDYASNAAEIRDKTRFMGFSEFNGRRVGELGADDLGFQQDAGTQDVTCDSMRILVDAEEYVPLQFRMNCTVIEGGETRQMAIEREDRDFRTVAGCGALYEPFTSVTRISGVMSPEEEAQLAEAAAQLEEMEAQLATMPDSQRQMMESMMGPQLEMIRNMAAGGGIEIVQSTTELRCNTGMPDPAEMTQTMFGTPPAGAGTVGTVPEPEPQDDTDMIRSIQLSLVELGYEPGNTDGVLDKATVVAISQFEVVRGLTVTGEPSWEIAGMLGRAVEDGAFFAPR